MNFYGYKRPDGRVGVRNKVLILPASVCASDTTRITVSYTHLDVYKRQCRIFAGDFLRSQGVAHLDILLVTHFHRDHIGGLGRVLETVTVGELLTPYAPPADSGPLDPDGDNGLPKAARNVLRLSLIHI